MAVNKNAAPSASAAIMFIVSIRHPHNANDGSEGYLLRPGRAGEPEANAPIPMVGRNTATT